MQLHHSEVWHKITTWTSLVFLKRLTVSLAQFITPILRGTWNWEQKRQQILKNPEKGNFPIKLHKNHKTLYPTFELIFLVAKLCLWLIKWNSLSDKQLSDIIGSIYKYRWSIPEKLFCNCSISDTFNWVNHPLLRMEKRMIIATAVLPIESQDLDNFPHDNYNNYPNNQYLQVGGAPWIFRGGVNPEQMEVVSGEALLDDWWHVCVHIIPQHTHPPQTSLHSWI